MPECKKTIDILSDPEQKAVARSRVTESLKTIDRTLNEVKKFVDTIGEDVADYVPGVSITKKTLAEICMSAVSLVGKKRVATAMEAVFSRSSIDEIGKKDYALAYAILLRITKGDEHGG